MLLCETADSWVGCDISIPVNFKISEMSKADREGQTHRGKPLPLSDDEERSEGMCCLLCLTAIVEQSRLLCLVGSTHNATL